MSGTKKNLPSYINQDKAEVVPKTTNITNINLKEEKLNNIYSNIEQEAEDAYNNPNVGWNLEMKPKLARAKNVGELGADEARANGVTDEFRLRPHA